MIKKTTLGLLVSSLILSGCGGSDSNKPSVPKDQLNGTAATGAPIMGNLTLVSADGKLKTFTVQEQGQFNFNSVSDLKTPAILKVVGASGGKAHELYSVVLNNNLESGTVNITPLTQLLISRATGVNAPEVFKAPNSYLEQLSANNLENAQKELKAVLSKLLIAANVDQNFDLLSSQFKADYTKIDSVLDLLDIEFSDTEAKITYRANRNYTVTLPYSSDWSNVSLLPEAMPVDEATEALSYLITADNILEAMVLEQDEDSYMQYLHPNAHWFGTSGRGIWLEKEVATGDEKSTDMDRYRDLSLTKVDTANNQFQITYTERFENSNFASGGRTHAWFAKDSQDGKYKFLGQEAALPVNISMFVKLETYDSESVEFNTREWKLEIDALPNFSDCENYSAPKDGWGWRALGDHSFVSTLPDASEHLGFDYVVISGPGIKTPLKLDKVFKNKPTGDNTVAGCHLVSSEYSRSPIIEGYSFDYDFTQPDVNPVPDNSVYTLSYYKDGASNPFYTDEITIGKGISPWDEMLPLLARKEELRKNAGDFYFKWSRISELMTDVDLWVYSKTGHVGAGMRVAVNDGTQEVSRSDLPEIGNVFLASFDQYGRTITRGYDVKF